jgi:guanylate kinase
MASSAPTKVIILGPSGSGKTFLKDYLRNQGYHVNVSCTSRPRREGEIAGRDYFFVDKKFFEQNEWIEMQSYNYWYYGTLKKFWNDAQVFIMNRKAIEQLREARLLDEAFIIYLDIEKEIRVRRLIKRNDSNDSVERRIKADEEEYEDFNLCNLKVCDENFLPERIYQKILDQGIKPRFKKSGNWKYL